MIPEYKFYQGVVLSELVDAAPAPIKISEVIDGGRLGSYVVNEKVGMQIKHSSARLSPWSFTLKENHLAQLHKMRTTLEAVFLVLVCGEIGMLALDMTEVTEICGATADNQYWLRVDKRPRGMFGVHGSLGTLRQKKSDGLETVVGALNV
ncbi:hypothetical protein ELH50_22625 [Rhizobium ruizarguesonis]|uniref:hypothetical protein n=1 Tax=Rhizobium ruizarguesonis TaxID=2081791 RepID=UPI0010307822|nr:hypothetical protein [Rhizobium ruizarguesonis]TBA92350.1 hypothetical protein ELH54_22150 [Rhizobium ruizarguesonis]TBB13707.1 hypothetical protein ELH50_22625 [Rhizobium ruizarguesonis]